MKKLKTIIVTVLFIIAGNTILRAQTVTARNTISLNGTWQIAEGSMDVIPKTFDHTVQVPGLVSLGSLHLRMWARK